MFSMQTHVQGTIIGKRELVEEEVSYREGVSRSVTRLVDNRYGVRVVRWVVSYQMWLIYT